MAIVEVEQVSKVYQQGEVAVRALDQVSLTVEPGDFMALAGPSGSGKTTLLNLIGGLDLPTAGQLRVVDKELATLSRGELAALRRDHIGFVFQSFNLIPVLTAFENAEFTLLLQGHGDKERRQRVMQILKEVGLAGLEHRFPNELSGGQQQRVAVARAIVGEPAIILADEPTANLDSKTAMGLLETMLQMNNSKGCTFIFSTHDPQVMQVAKKLVYLHDGVITEIKQQESG